MNNSPKVTIEQINSLIASEHYFTASDGVSGASNGKVKHDSTNPMSLLTFCVLRLNSGFTVTGESACLSPDNFNAQTGREVARNNAISKIWMLEGYRIKSDLHQAEGHA